MFIKVVFFFGLKNNLQTIKVTVTSKMVILFFVPPIIWLKIDVMV